MSRRLLTLALSLLLGSTSAISACPGSLALGLPLLFGTEVPSTPWPSESNFDERPVVDLVVPEDLEEAQEYRDPPAPKVQALECLKAWRQLVREGRFEQAAPVAAKAASLDPTNLDAQQAVIVSQALRAIGEKPAATTKSCCEAECPANCCAKETCASGSCAKNECPASVCPLAQALSTPRAFVVELNISNALTTWLNGCCPATALRARVMRETCELPGAAMTPNGLVAAETRVPSKACEVPGAVMTENGLAAAADRCAGCPTACPSECPSACPGVCPRQEIVEIRRGELKPLPANANWDVTYGENGLEAIQRSAIRQTNFVVANTATPRVGITTKGWSAECDRMQTVGDHEVVLEGNVRLTYRLVDMTVNAVRVRVNLRTSAFTFETK